MDKMENKLHLSVVIPAYNEAKRISATVLDIEIKKIMEKDM